MLIVTALNDRSNNEVLTADSNDFEDFADFTSFQTDSLSSQSMQSQFTAKTEPTSDISSPAISLASVPSNYSSVVSNKGVSEKYQQIKELISDVTLFTSGPSLSPGVTQHDTDDEWLDYKGTSFTNVVHNSADANIVKSSSADDDWADFQGTLSADGSQDTVPDVGTQEPPVSTKWSSVTNFSNTSHSFGKPTHPLFYSSALDFSPPELPPENDDDDANYLGFYSVSGVDGGQGISSLCTVDLEDDSVENVRSGGEFLKCDVQGMTSSNSTSSFEFTGWLHDSKPGLASSPADAQSTHSLDLPLSTDTSKRSPNSSASLPAAEADSQSVNSLEFTSTSERRMRSSGVVRADSDRMSLHSLELKSTAVSADDESSSGVGREDVLPLGAVDNAPTCTGLSVQ